MHGQPAAISHLLKSGAKLGAVDLKGTSALHLAARHGQVAAVRVLLEAGASTAAADGNGASTPTSIRRSGGSLIV